MKTIRIDNEIELRTISLASAKLIYNSINRSRKHLRLWLPFVDQTKTEIDTRNFIKSVLNSTSPKKDEIFEIWYLGAFAGLIGFKEIDKTNNKVEIGYWLDAEMTGKGIMVRACRAMTAYAFSNLKMNRVMIKVAVRNNKSEAIPKKLNYYFEGLERDGEFHSGKYLNLSVYSMLKQEWIK